jgi:hypothetical protein
MNTKNMFTRGLSLVTWKEVRDDVNKVNPELAKRVDKLNPDDSYKIVKARYYYGDVFVNNGETFLPNNKNVLVPISDPSIDPKIREELSYTPMPIFMSLNKSSELFFDTGKRTIPLNLFHKGELAGLYETMDYLMGVAQKPIWSFSAGARSIFMLPKITDKINLNKLHLAYDIPTTTQVKNLTDHWEMFKHIAQNDPTGCHWQSEVLFFCKEWFDRKYESKIELSLRDYILKVIWRHANFAIDKVKFNMFWEAFASIISSRRLQPKPYLIDQVKHLLSIVAGNFPGFIVANNAEEVAPIKCLQEAFIKHYSLKEYLPTIMYASMPATCEATPKYFYYSLANPTVLEGSPVKKNTSTIVNDLREIKMLIETLKNRTDSHNAHNITQIIQNTNIDYFHYKNDTYNQIRASDNIALDDSTFLQDQAKFGDRKFCPTSPFFSGCIRIEKPKSFLTKLTCP